MREGVKFKMRESSMSPTPQKKNLLRTGTNLYQHFKVDSEHKENLVGTVNDSLNKCERLI